MSKTKHSIQTDIISTVIYRNILNDIILTLYKFNVKFRTYEEKEKWLEFTKQKWSYSHKHGTLTKILDNSIFNELSDS